MISRQASHASLGRPGATSESGTAAGAEGSAANLQLLSRAVSRLSARPSFTAQPANLRHGGADDDDEEEDEGGTGGQGGAGAGGRPERSTWAAPAGISVSSSSNALSPKARSALSPDHDWAAFGSGSPSGSGRRKSMGERPQEWSDGEELTVAGREGSISNRAAGMLFIPEGRSASPLPLRSSFKKKQNAVGEAGPGSSGAGASTGPPRQVGWGSAQQAGSGGAGGGPGSSRASTKRVTVQSPTSTQSSDALGDDDMLVLHEPVGGPARRGYAQQPTSPPGAGAAPSAGPAPHPPGAGAPPQPGTGLGRRARRASMELTVAPGAVAAAADQGGAPSSRGPASSPSADAVGQARQRTAQLADAMLQSPSARSGGAKPLSEPAWSRDSKEGKEAVQRHTVDAGGSWGCGCKHHPVRYSTAHLSAYVAMPAAGAAPELALGNLTSILYPALPRASCPLLCPPSM